MRALNDTQRVLLSHAAKQARASLHPLPASIDKAHHRVIRAIGELMKLRLIEERETSEAGIIHRMDGNLQFGLFINAAGLAAIGVSEPDELDVSTPPPASSPARVSKLAAVIDLLSREVGATGPELIAATSWLPHTVRAALTGLRKKGHVIERTKRDEATCYRIVVAA
jgi:hypothetical protein